MYIWHNYMFFSSWILLLPREKKWKKYYYYYSIIWEDDGTFFFGLLKNKPFESFRLLQRQQLIKVWKQSVFKCYVLVSLFPLGKILSSCFVRCSETAAAEKKGDLCDFFFFLYKKMFRKEGRFSHIYLRVIKLILSLHASHTLSITMSITSLSNHAKNNQD